MSKSYYGKAHSFAYYWKQGRCHICSGPACRSKYCTSCRDSALHDPSRGGTPINDFLRRQAHKQGIGNLQGEALREACLAALERWNLILNGTKIDTIHQ